MTDKATVTIVILWESELRIAAKCLRQMQDASDEEFPEKAHQALQACLVALNGLADESKTMVMLGASEARLLSKKAGHK